MRVVKEKAGRNIFLPALQCGHDKGKFEIINLVRIYM